MAPTNTTTAPDESTDGTGGGTGGIVGTTPAGTGTLAAGAHVPILHLATSLPVPTGDVPKVVHNVSWEDQRAQAEEIFKFLIAPSPALSRLNEGSTCYVAVVSVPRTSLVKVVYGIGVGSSPIGAMASPVDGKLLLLQGDGNLDIGPPQPICLPATMVEAQQVATMTEHSNLRWS